MAVTPLVKARLAIASWNDPYVLDLWREVAPLRAALDEISEDDALVLLSELEQFDTGDDHLLADEIVSSRLSPRLRDAYRKLADGVGWYYS